MFNTRPTAFNFSWRSGCSLNYVVNSVVNHHQVTVPGTFTSDMDVWVSQLRVVVSGWCVLLLIGGAHVVVVSGSCDLMMIVVHIQGDSSETVNQDSQQYG